jgi:hypothetical protein
MKYKQFEFSLMGHTVEYNGDGYWVSGAWLNDMGHLKLLIRKCISGEMKEVLATDVIWRKP